MRLIYYSTAYYATHGGSNHSKAFVKYAKANKDVEDLLIFPAEKPNVNSSIKNAKSILSSIYNSRILLGLKLWRRKKLNLQELYAAIESFKPNALVIRMDNNFLQINSIKKSFPSLIIATEVNASPFEESFKDIYFKSYFQSLERSSLAKADLNFFVTSELRKNIFGNNYNPSRDFVNQNGYDTDLFFPVDDKRQLRVELNLPADKKLIGYVGTLDIHKKLDLLVYAAAKLVKSYKDFNIVIIGDGPYLQTLKEFVALEELEPYFIFTGRLNHKDVPKYIQAFDIGLHHAANDYMSPLKLFEYLAVKLPTVAPNTSSVKEIFTDGKDIILTKPDSEDIYQKLLGFIKNPAKAQALAEEGYRTVKTNYTWQHNADRVITEIQKLQK